jgi:hypothetical protein
VLGANGQKPKKELTEQQKEKLKQKRVLESCLTLVRSLYTREEVSKFSPNNPRVMFVQKSIQDFVMEHPTQQKDRLMNKILAQMMITCREKVSADQVELLQTFKDSAADFDPTPAEYATLLNFDLNNYRVDPSWSEERQQGPVDMTPAESRMQAVVEDLSEDMKREREEEFRGRGNAPQIAFVDLSTLSGPTAALYILGIIGFFGVIFYVLINKILAKPVDFQKIKKQERATKRVSGNPDSAKKAQ